MRLQPPNGQIRPAFSALRVAADLTTVTAAAGRENCEGVPIEVQAVGFLDPDWSANV
jgi:hypothetical protein